MSSLSEKGLRLSKNALFNVFVSRAGKLLGKPFQVITALNEVADKLADKKSKDHKFRQLFEVGQTLVRLLRRYISGEYRGVSSGTIILGLAVLLYVLSPIDLVPDFIPVLGFLDDLSLISWFVGKFQDEIVQFREWEVATRQQGVAGANTTTPEPARGDRLQLPVAELGHS